MTGTQTVARLAVLLKVWLPWMFALWLFGSRALWAAKRNDLSQTHAGCIGPTVLVMTALLLFSLVGAPAIIVAGLLALLNAGAWAIAWWPFRSTSA